MRRYKEATANIRVRLPLQRFNWAFANLVHLGTWVPLHEGRLLAERNGVLAKLLPFLDFVPGPISPPQAPKHQTAASNKGPKVPKPKKAAMNSHSRFKLFYSSEPRSADIPD